jgi:hypothetical protein
MLYEKQHNKAAAVVSKITQWRGEKRWRQEEKYVTVEGMPKYKKHNKTTIVFGPIPPLLSYSLQ